MRPTSLRSSDSPRATDPRRRWAPRRRFGADTWRRSLTASRLAAAPGTRAACLRTATHALEARHLSASASATLAVQYTRTARLAGACPRTGRRGPALRRCIQSTTVRNATPLHRKCTSHSLKFGGRAVFRAATAAMPRKLDQRAIFPHGQEMACRCNRPKPRPK